MKRVLKITVPALLAAMTFGFSAQAWAQSIVLVVDTQEIWNATELGQDISRQLQELGTSLQTQLQQGEDELRSGIEELTRQREEFIITDEVYEQRLAELQQQNQALRAGFEVSGQAMQYAQRRGQAAFFEAILPELSAIMDERSGTVLVERSATILAATDADITAEVITRINARITELEVELLPLPAPPEEE